MHVEILDKKRREALPVVAAAGEGFYLAGGTALALQLGHRDSIDFDFFRPESFDTAKLFEHVSWCCRTSTLRKQQEEKNTLTLLIDDEIQLSFFSYDYPLLNPVQKYEGLELASIEDIAAMKLTTITSRSTLKDYVDLYYILQDHRLSDLLRCVIQKFPTANQNLILKSLVYFDDIEPEPIRFMSGYDVSLKEVQAFLVKTVRAHQAGV